MLSSVVRARVIWFNSGQLTHVDASKTIRDAPPVLQKGHEWENTCSGVAGVNGRRRGLGCGRSGASTVEVRNLDSEIGAEEEAS